MSKSFFPNEEGCHKPDEETINNYKDLFTDYRSNLPTIKEALFHLFHSSGLTDQRSNEYTNAIFNKTKSKLEDNNYFKDKIQKAYPGISFEEAQIISSYTC